jgi:hypothetical protein
MNCWCASTLGALELANHLFTWAGDLVIEEPSA